MAYTPDLTIVQEARKVKTTGLPDIWRGPSPNNGISVIPGDDVRVEFCHQKENVLWSIIPLEISGKQDFHALGVWTRKEHGYMNSLKTALTSYRDFLSAAPCVVLGDFNCSAIWDNSAAGFSPLANILEGDLGLKSAYHSFYGEQYGEETRPTFYFRWSASKPFHIDYCFVPSDWNILSVEVGSYDGWALLSDHRPLIIDVDM
ncbi:endonuclease/exonuclease/phosphatase family protein [Desulfoferula mesophila]|uniref:endonuclease/exonuclease/phosphatase family protein n=1 Tax=Desulfoferula mesophila TaxID=3058419 RepID=UPI0030D5933F